MYRNRRVKRQLMGVKISAREETATDRGTRGKIQKRVAKEIECEREGTERSEDRDRIGRRLQRGTGVGRVRDR